MGNAVSEYHTKELDVHGSNETLESVLKGFADKKAWDKVTQIFLDNPSISFTAEKSSQRLPLHLAILNHAPQSLVQALVSSNGLAVNVLDAAGESPVHYAITSKASFEIIQVLTQANHTCMEVCDAQGLLPLHKALEYRSPTPIILHILNTYPDGAFERTKDGKLALHYACEHQASLEVLQLLLELNNDATSEAHNGRLPIHYCCEHKSPLDIITALHTANETCIATKGIDGMYPLHAAVKFKSSVAVVEYLIHTFPDALMHRDRKGLHPIHYALERNAPDMLVKCILTHRPETASLRGKGSPGNFPLSTALDKHYSSEIVRMILQAYPQAAGEANMLRFLPLQSAMKHNISDISLLTELLQAYPTAASVVDNHHRIVLHYCASRNMDLDFVKRLLEANPLGANAKDKNEQIPLHLAVTRLCDLSLIKLLLSYHQHGVLDSDRFGLNPLNYAIENNAAIDMIQILIQANPKCTQHKISQNRTVLHQAVEFRRSTEVVQALVQAYPEATQIQESAQGRLPQHWAIERLLPLPTLLCIDDANPTQGAYVHDLKGWRSIHYAIHYPTPTPIVTRILQANSSIATIRDDTLHIQYYNNMYEKYYTALYKDYVAPVVADKDAFLLLHYAIAHDALPETVAEMLLYTMPFSPSGIFNPHHYDTWMYITAYSGDKYWQSIDIVLTRYEHNQSIITQLAEFRDQTTVRCMDIATPRCLHEILRRMYYYSRYEMHNKLSIHKSRYSLVHSAIYHNTVFGATIVNNPTNLDSLSSAAATNNNNGNTGSKNMNSYDKSTNDTVTTPVVLKFTNQRSKYIRETVIRTRSVIASSGSVRTNNTTLNPNYIIEMLAWHNAQEDLKYGSEIVLKGFEKYSFLMVFKQGDRDLGSICKHEHLTATTAEEGEDSSLDLIRSYMVMILKCVQYLHEDVGVVHGDLKPSNIIRESNTLKLTNLGAACNHTNKELVSAELQQLAYAAPELALLQRHTDDAHRRAVSRGGEQVAHDPHFHNAAAQLCPTPSSAVDFSIPHSHPSDLAPVPNVSHARIIAHPSQDMWSVGAIFYLLLTGESLFLNSVSEDIDSDQVDMLIEWPEFVKQRRLEKVQNVYARALLSQLLSKDPHQRPSAQYCLRSVFCTNTVSPVRYYGIGAEYDVYVCYRRQSYYNGTAVDAPLLLDANEKAEETEEVVVPLTDITDTMVEEEDLYRVKSKSQRKDSALNRMFGNISLSDSELNEEDSLMSEIPENNSLDADSAEMSTFDDQLSDSKKNGLDSVKAIDTSTDDGKYSLLQQYCRAVGLSAAPTATVTLSHGPTTADYEVTTPTSSRDILLTKCSAAVIMLTRETWKCLEDLNARLIKEDKKNNPRGSMKANKIDAVSSIAETSESDALLEDFLYELRIIIELQSMGLLERGVYIYAIGSPTVNTTGDKTNTNHLQNSENGPANEIATVAEYVLDSYFQHFLGEMVGRYGNSHPPSSMPNVTMPSLEKRVTDYLTQCGYGVQSRHANMSLYEMFRFLVRVPTFHLLGPEKDAYQTATTNLMKVISGSGRINQSNSEGMGMFDSASRPNTGAFNLLRNSRLGSPQVLPRLTSANNRTTMHATLSNFPANGSFTNAHSGSFSYNNMGSRNIGSIAAGITAGVNTGILGMGGTVPRTLSRGGLHSSSGRLHTPHSLSYSIPATPTNNIVLVGNLSLPAINTHSNNHASHDNLYPSNQHSDTVYYPPARSPVTGLRVRTYSPSRTPQRVNYTDVTSEHMGTVHNMHNNNMGDGLRGKTPLGAQQRPITAGESYDHAHNIPVRSWSHDEAEHMHGNNNNLFNHGFEPLLENEVTFYNNQDIVTVPYFTEIIGEDRVRTANAMSYMTNKLEESENTIANLEDELALLRQQMHNKDAELSKLRTVVRANQSVQPMNSPGAASVSGSSVVMAGAGGKKK